MKPSIPLLSLLLIASVSCASKEEKNTRLLLEGIISAIDLYEAEYQKPIDAQSSIELADVLERKNRRQIIFYDFWGARSESGEIIDAYGNPILFMNENGVITLHSKGENGVVDSAPGNDDIIMHYESKAEPVDADNPGNPPENSKNQLDD